MSKERIEDRCTVNKNDLEKRYDRCSVYDSSSHLGWGCSWNECSGCCRGKTAVAEGWKVLGVEDGYDGLIEARWTELGTVVWMMFHVRWDILTFNSSTFRTKEGRERMQTTYATRV